LKINHNLSKNDKTIIATNPETIIDLDKPLFLSKIPSLSEKLETLF